MKAKAKRLTGLLCALAMGASMMPVPAPSAAPAEAPAMSAVTSPDGGVTIDKSVSGEYLDQSLETTVTLTVSGSERMDKVAVLFVFDKSTSVDVRGAARDLMDALAKKENTDIKFSVVNFDADAAVQTNDTGSGWMTFEPDQAHTYEKYFSYSGKSGTNYHAGLLKAKQLLASEEIAGYTPYLITVSDGITYIWNEDLSGDAEPATVWANLSDENAAGSSTQNGASSWEFKYREAGGTIHGFDWLYPDGGIDAFLQTAGEAYAQTMAAGLLYPHSQQLAQGMKVAIFEGNGTESATGRTMGYKEIGSDGKQLGELTPASDVTYLTAPEAAVYQTAETFRQLVEAMKAEGSHIYALCMPEDDGSDQWTNNPFGKELMGYLAGLTPTTVDDGVIMNATAEETFADIRDEILYAVESGTITDGIGPDFDLAGLDSFSLQAEEETLTPVVDGEQNTVTFYAPSDGSHSNALYTVRYEPAAEGERFTLSIDTPVEKDRPLKLSYRVRLSQPSGEAGLYTLPTNSSAVLTYRSTDGGAEQTLTFPVPTVKYAVAQLRPADMTIYMGGDGGYDGVADSTGSLVGNNSLPEPGYYVTLPDEINQALSQAGLVSGQQPADLSGVIRIHSVGTAPGRSWTLAPYGSRWSSAYGKYVYAVVPAEGTAPFRLNFTDAEGKIYDSDSFDPAVAGALYQDYTMEIYQEPVEKHQILVEVSVPEGETYRCLLATQTGQLKIRYVSGDQNSVVTPAYTSVEEASRADDPSQKALKKAYVIRDPDTRFFINGSGIDVSESEGFARVSLLFDDIVPGTETGGSDYRSLLADRAMKAAAGGLSSVRYEARYLDLVDANNGNVWLTPSKAVTVYWPYPAGTNASTPFRLVHFEGLDREMNTPDVAADIAAAELEVLEVRTDAYGISFTTDSFSPFVLLWDDSQTTTVTEEHTAHPQTDKTDAAEAKPLLSPVIPQTGDTLPFALLAVLAAVSAGAVTVLTLLRRRGR